MMPSIGKSSPDGIEPVSIRFFPLEVLKEQNKWAEMKERQRQWFPIDHAIDMIEDEDFRIVLKAFMEIKQTKKLDAA
ncbi:MAG: hypothetical protein U5K75_09150 [Ahrensia sp.]|nr:hypothetical protein [Ahrensia sp.]